MVIGVSSLTVEEGENEIVRPESRRTGGRKSVDDKLNAPGIVRCFSDFLDTAEIKDNSDRVAESNHNSDFHNNGTPSLSRGAPTCRQQRFFN